MAPASALSGLKYILVNMLGFGGLSSLMIAFLISLIHSNMVLGISDQHARGNGNVIMGIDRNGDIHASLFGIEKDGDIHTKPKGSEADEAIGNVKQEENDVRDKENHEQMSDGDDQVGCECWGISLEIMFSIIIGGMIR